MGRMWHNVILRGSIAGLKSEFYFSKTCYLTKIQDPSLPSHLHVTVRRRVGFIHFLNVLVLYEMQTDLPRFEIESPDQFPTTRASLQNQGTR